MPEVPEDQLSYFDRVKRRYAKMKAKEAQDIKAQSEKEISGIKNIFGIKEVVAFMLDNEGSPGDLDEFIKVTNLHDDYRNESFATTFPEYWGLLNETN